MKPGQFTPCCVVHHNLFRGAGNARGGHCGARLLVEGALRSSIAQMPRQIEAERTTVAGDRRAGALASEVGADLADAISAELVRLETEAEKLKGEIAELIGADETLMV
jgi:hypothetical protein